MSAGLGNLDSPVVGRCDRCHRATWSETDLGMLDKFPQPLGGACGGTFRAEAPTVPPELCGFGIGKGGTSTGACVFTPHPPGTPHSWAPEVKPGESMRDADRRILAERAAQGVIETARLVMATERVDPIDRTPRILLSKDEAVTVASTLDWVEGDRYLYPKQEALRDKLYKWLASLT